MFKRHLIFTVLVLAMLGLAGCGSSGSSDSSSSSSPTSSPSSNPSGLAASVGGAAVNHPVVGGRIDVLKSIDLDPSDDANWTTNIGTTSTGGSFSFSSSTLSGISYPAMIRVKGGTGTIPNGAGATQTYASDLYALIESEPTANITINFTLFSSLGAKLYKEKVAAGLSTAEAVQVAKEKVLGVMSAMGLDTTTLSDPQKVSTSDPGVILAQATLWSGNGQSLNMDSAGAASANVASMLDSLVGQMKNNADPITTLKALPTIAAQLNAAVSDTEGLQSFMTTTVANDANYKDTLEKAYTGIVTNADTTIAQAKTEVDVATNAAKTVGKFVVTGITAPDATVFTDGSTSIQVPAGATKVVPVVVNATLGSGRAVNSTAQVTVTSDSTALSVTTNTPVSFANDAFSATVQCTFTNPTAAKGTLTFKITLANGATAVAYVNVVAYGATESLPTQISALNAQTSSADKRLIDLNSNTDAYTVTATVGTTGSAIDSPYYVNFYAPSGLKFALNSATAKAYSNYMKPISSGTATLGTASVYMVNGTTTAPASGQRGPLRAVVYSKSGDTFTQYSPAIEKSTTDFYSTNEGAGALRKMTLTTNSSKEYLNMGNSVNNSTGTINFAATYPLKLTFVTWGGDTDIDSVAGNTFDPSIAGINSKWFQLYTSAPHGGGFNLGSSTYGNIGMGLGAYTTTDFTNVGGNGVLSAITDTNFSGTFNSQLADYKTVFGQTSTASNSDYIWVKMFNVSTQPSSETAAKGNSTNTILIKYQQK